MVERSLWHKDVIFPSFPRLNHDLRTDVLIIGGGMAGILCARMLSKRGVNCALIEENTIGSGTTKNTTAKITCQHGLIYHKLLKRLGRERTQMYLAANQSALEAYRALSAGADCDFETADNFVYSTCKRRILEKELNALLSLGVHAEYVKELPLPLSTQGAVRINNQAQFHPLKFLCAVSEGLAVFEHTRALEISKGCVRTEGGLIRAEKIIIATHFPLLNKHGSYFLKLYQHRSYVLALDSGVRLQGMYVDENDKGMSFRRYGDFLLLGGGGHRTGRQGGSFPELSNFAARHYPCALPAFEWAAQDCMTLDGVPYIGQYSASTPNLYVATGFNKWGMTGAMVSAMLLGNMLTDKAPDWAEVFSPSRSMLRPQLLINTAEAARSILTPTAPRCPHMGCALKYNPQEHSWDCPCHGSRFTENGERIENPATGDLKKKPPKNPS